MKDKGHRTIKEIILFSLLQEGKRDGEHLEGKDESGVLEAGKKGSHEEGGKIVLSLNM